MSNQDYLQHENFLSNKENLNRFEDTMDEPMDIDPSTPFANKIRQSTVRAQQQNEEEDLQLKEQQITNGPNIVKPGPKIVKPIVVRPIVPKVIKPQGLPLPQINNNCENSDEFNEDDIDPFRTKSKISFDTTEFQTPGGFNLRLSDETMNEGIKEDESMMFENQDPFKTKSTIMNSPTRTTAPTTLFKSPPPPPIFAHDNLNSNIEDLNNSENSNSQQTTETNSLTDEWETHQKRSSNNRSLNSSLTKSNKSPLTKQSSSAVSSNTDLSSSDNLNSSPPQNIKSNNLNQALSISPSESHSDSTSVYSSHTASSSSINNNKNSNELAEQLLNENLSSKLEIESAKNLMPARQDEPLKDDTKLPEEEIITRSVEETKEKDELTENEIKVSDEVIPPVAADIQINEETFKTPTKKNMEKEIDDETMMYLKNNNFIGGAKNNEANLVEPLSTETVCEKPLESGNLVDFGSDNDNVNDNDDTKENKEVVDQVVFDSIFSNDNDFNSFLDLLEKKEVDNSIKKSPKYSEFARKSLYLQFDPITQLNLSSSLSPEKVKRLSLIVDKKNAIKNFLCDIAESDTINEEETEETTGNNQAVEEIAADVKVEADKVSVEELASEKLLVINESKPLAEVDLEKDELILSDKSKEEVKEKEAADMIITNEMAFSEAENFSKKLDLKGSEDLIVEDKAAEEVKDRSKKQEINLINQENDLIEETKSKIQSQGIAEKRLSNIHNDSSFKLMTDDSMMLDESQLLPNIKSNRTSEILKQINPVVTKNSSTEDLSSSSVCMSSASAQEMAKVMAELNELKEREKNYLQRIDSLEEENDKFKAVAIDFEDIFTNLVKDKEESEVKLKNEIIELTKERDHLQEDVIGVERAFDDLHRRFEKLKTKVEEFKRNEESLQNAIEVYKQQLDKEKTKYSTLKRHAEEKIDFANSEIEKLRKSTGVEIQRLNAELRKAEIKISSLDLSVSQKDQENSQLTTLLEDLLQKVKP